MRNYFIIALTISLGTLFSSCQNAEDNCIYVDKRRCDPNFVLPEIAEGIVVLESPISDYNEKVLLEDFTGFRCTNCLPATVTATNLKSSYPDRLSIVGVHCTAFFAAPVTSDTSLPYHKDFRTPEGEEFVTYYNLQSLPNGAINRLGIDGNATIPFAAWTDRLNALFSENNPEVYISIKGVEIDEENQEIVANVHAKPLISNSESYLINLTITEDDIPEAQKNSSSPGGEILDYVHNHVFRGSAYGPWGIDVFEGDIDLRTNEVLSYKLKMDINPIWNLDNCEVLVFISKSSNREVVQVEEVSLR